MDKQQTIHILEFYSNINKEMEFNNNISFSNQIEKLMFLKNEINQELKTLPYKEKNILFLFYIKKQCWGWISKTMTYSIRQCKNIRTTALLKLSERFEKNQAIKSFQFPE